ncbi:MAG TPA: HYR domain-containing protein, partial [Gaiellaceae bacterium]|nr:HYR domain-containing protein [Gaiellaceae bacterium]
AGAIGVIITNTPTSSNPDEAPNLIGADPTTDPTITIPAVGVSLNTGNLIKSNIGVGVVTATLTGALDNEAPVLALPDNLSVGTNSGCSYAGPIGTATASDDTTPPALIQITNDAPASFPLGSTTVTWLATDANGSERSGTQLVVVGDDDRPSLTAPENRTVGTNSGAAYDGGIGAASASDNCSSGGALSITNDAPAALPLGQTTVTWLVTDATGNSASAIQLVTVVDDDAPTLTAPASITVLSDPGTVSAVILDAALGTATASDNAGPVTMTRSGVPTGNLFPLGKTTITYTATDAFGNQATATQTVTVRARDSEAPNLVAPPSLVVNATSPAGAVVTYAASATDDADPNPVVSCTPASGSTFAIGVTTVRCTATDNAGNSSQANFTVTVKGPVQQIVDLIDKTLAFMDQPQLEATLKAQLQAVVAALVANRPTVVCGLLNTYIAAVKAAPARAGLTPAQKAELVADANRIKTVVGCR